YEDVRTAFHDPRFSADRTQKMCQMAGRADLAPFFSFLSNRMLYNDPPRHTRLRGLTSKAFTPRVIESMRPHIQALVDGFFDRVQSNGRMDIIADLAYQLPVTVILELLGVPVADREKLKKWSDEFVAYFARDPSQVTSEEYQKAIES